MKILMLLRFYGDHLKWFYGKNPGLGRLSYREHKERIARENFSWPLRLLRYASEKGFSSDFIVVNDIPLQRKWIDENGAEERSWEKTVAEQIKRLKPDILWIDGIFDLYGDFIKEISGYAGKVVTWIALPFRKEIDPRGISVLFTENPGTYAGYHDRFEKVIVLKPGFDGEVLKLLGSPEKDHDITFIGTISPSHAERADTLAFLIRNGIDIGVFGRMDQPGFLSDVKAILSDMVRKGKGRDIGRAAPEGKDILREYVKNCEVIRTKHRGPLYDLEMYKTLARSKLTLNMHIGLAGGYSGNMRMYEATGSGACLVTEGFENTPELFEPGREILTYSHKEELLDKLKDIISGKKWKETGMVAKEGQKRTIRDYNMERLFEKVKPALEL